MFDCRIVQSIHQSSYIPREPHRFHSQHHSLGMGRTHHSPLPATLDYMCTLLGYCSDHAQGNIQLYILGYCNARLPILRYKHRDCLLTQQSHSCRWRGLKGRCREPNLTHASVEPHSSHSSHRSPRYRWAENRRWPGSPGMHTWDPHTYSTSSQTCRVSCPLSHRSTFPAPSGPTPYRQTPTSSSGALLLYVESQL